MIKAKWKVIRRFLRTFFAHSPVLAVKYAIFRRMTSNKEWDRAKEEAVQISEMAIKYKDARIVKEMFLAYFRFGDQEKSSILEMEWSYMTHNIKDTDWKGEDLSDATLWISFKDTEKQGIATGYNMVGYVYEALKTAKHVVIVVDKRLVSLFQRTFNQANVYAGPILPVAHDGTRLVTANSSVLKFVLGTKQSDVNRYFAPFIVDKNMRNMFIREYNSDNQSRLPIIGISWSPYAHGRLKAPFKLWVDLVKSIPAIFVIIQIKYNDNRNSEIKDEIGQLKLSAVGRIIDDESVNPYLDMDRLASQLASLDAVVGINSSDVSLAGALGIPAYMVCDDLFTRMCPVLGNKYPWYPDAVVYNKNGRSWSELFDELQKDLSESVIFH